MSQKDELSAGPQVVVGLPGGSVGDKSTPVVVPAEPTTIGSPLSVPGLLAGAPVPIRGIPMEVMVFGHVLGDGSEAEEVVVLRPPGSVAVPGADRSAPLVRLHSACITGEVFGSTKCDCGPQFNAALELIQQNGNGALLYLLRHEGRGIGLANKIRAYDLQACGHDTVAANQVLGLPVDSRNFQAATAVLRSLGYTQVRLMTNNPDKIHAVEDSGIQVLERVPFGGFTNADNIDYLAVKDARLGHLDSLGTERPFDSGTPA